jgi:hypothetical protein
MSRMSRDRARRGSIRPVIPGLVAVAVVVIACGTVGPSTPPTTGPTTAQTGTTGPTPSASAPAPVTAGASIGATASAGPAAQPPGAALAVDGGDAVRGQLGSYTWNGAGSDSPWLAGAPISVGQGERLGVALDGGAVVAAWTARRVVAGATDGAGAVALGEGQGAVAFPVPPPGIWSVQVTVQFAGGLGSATYYWQVTVR